MFPRTSQHQRFAAAASLCTLLFVTFAAGASEEHISATDSSLQAQPQPTTSSDSNNFNCPVDCRCILTENTHKPMLHAKCSSIADLRSDSPLRATLPIHSIDLSYLGLPRLSHLLEKLRDLTSVDLSHNDLHEIGHLGRRIKKLNLKHNRITSAKLSKLPQYVQVLNLQHNDITQLPLEFTKLTQLQSLELSHNQINCSCETLEVRNWLQLRHVFMEHPVKCMFPAEVKGKSWLQVKQADICEKEKRGWYSDAAAEENELMLGDQPMEGSTMHDNEEDEEELGKAFMPIDQKPSKSTELKLSEDVEGSGDLSELNLSLELAPTVEPPMLLARMEEASSTKAPQTDMEKEEEEDGSGSGGGMLIIPHLARGPLVLDDFDQPDSQEDLNTVENFDRKPSSDIFGNGMGIFDGEKAQDPVTEDDIVPVVHHEQLATLNGGEDGGKTTEEVPVDTTEGAATGPAVMQAEVGAKDDGNAIYFLLGVIVLIVVGLILYVGIKRCKKNHRSRDVENPRSTELLDMDKRNLGKPVQRNGNGTEHSPLIGEKTKVDLARPVNGTGKKPYDASDVKDGPTTQQPLLNGNGMPANGNAKVAAESDNTAPELPRIVDPLGSAPHEYHPITPRYPPPKSPRASKYGHPEPNNNEDVFLPSSPKSGRYSPVYSPETGRVKIKLTETPKPKTPMLVTRSKSNAGDIITTPIRAAQLDVPEADTSRC